MFYKIMRWSVRRSCRMCFKGTKALAARPMVLSLCLLFVVVACDSARNAVDTITLDNRSPYGGTDKPVRVKVGKSYTIKGKRYHPKHEPDYVEEGMASWYGPGFHGRKTANGERYDQYEMTAAHRTLPMPCLVRVTRTDTGKSIVVRVNDRGPFAHGRIIDLSKAAAKELGMLKMGVAPVKVEYLEDETLAYMDDLGLKVPDYMQKRPVSMAQRVVRRSIDPITQKELAPAHTPTFDDVLRAPSDGTFRVQTASFSSRSAAKRHAMQLKPVGEADIFEVSYGGNTYYRVATKPVNDYESAIAMLRQTQNMGYSDARIMVE